ncbi:MAG: DNA cytosine methyltransferase [Anaerolineales bacterium]
MIDLFSGCGGMSLGFKRAGFEILGGIENDAKAAETYARNLLKEYGRETVQRHAKPRDIRYYLPDDFSREFLESEPVTGKVDLIIAGPPCQAFARIGRAKLRAIMDHEEAFLNDHRADLYTNFLLYVEAFKPRAVVMENVPEILNFGGKNVGDEISASLRNLGYDPGYSLLNAAHFGVPQSRVRFFLIGFRADLGLNPLLPEPTHHAETRNDMYYYPENGGSGNALQYASSFIDKAERAKFQYYVGLINPNRDLPGATTVNEAIGDLPPVYTSEIDGKEARSAFSTVRKYRPGRPSSYASEMRNWPTHKAKNGVTDNAIRYLPRDHEIFSRMSPGDQYPEAHQIAEAILVEKLEAYQSEHDYLPRPGSQEYARIKKLTVPPYAKDKFPNKWQKLDPDKPSHTLTAHLAKDSYSHIHFDSQQARVISVREAARLQSFPDGFEFPPTLTHSLRQIGNAVPPLLAYRLAEVIARQLR